MAGHNQQIGLYEPWKGFNVGPPQAQQQQLPAAGAGSYINLGNYNNNQTGAGAFPGLNVVQPTPFDTTPMDVGIPPPKTGSTWRDRMFGYTDADGNVRQGNAQIGLGLVKGVADTWIGMQELDLAKKSFVQNSAIANEDMAMRRGDVTRQLDERYDQRVAQGSAPASSKEEYRARYGL
jgi:hypothetical protein